VGSKFAHISIFDSNIKEAIKLLEFLPKRPILFDKMNKAVPGVIKALQTMQARDKNAKWSLEWLSTSKTVYYVGKNNKLVTIFSEEFNWESIDNQTLAMSEKSPKIFLTVSNYDDDVFQLSIIKDGKILTKHISNSGGYGIKPEIGDMEVIANIFEITGEKDKLKEILENKDVPKKMDALQKLLNVDLWLDEPDELIKNKWQKVIIR
jgi:hypothetical protein